MKVTSDCVNDEPLRALREGRPQIYCTWNEHILFLIYYLKPYRIPVLMTPKAKSDTITRFAQLMGLQVQVGSLEGGGRHALISLLDFLKMGRPIFLAADGNRGPTRKCKAGPFILAQESQAKICPVSWTCKYRFKIERSYGHLNLPYPFSTIEVSFGAPISITKHHQFNELEELKADLTRRLNDISP